MAVEKQRLHFRSFDGGLNQKLNPNMLEENQFQRFENWTFDDFGLAVQRDGVQQFGRRLGNEPIDGVFLYRPENETNEVIIVTDGDVYRSEVGGAIESSPLFQNFSKDKIIQSEQMEDILFLTDSVNELKKYKDGTVSKAGIEEPDESDQTGSSGGAPNVSAGSSPGISGTYKYRVTYVSDTSESNPSDQSTDIQVSDEKIELSDIPVSKNTQVNKRNIYRTQDGGQTFFKAGEINNNTDTTFTDDKDDSALGKELDFESGVPPEGVQDIEEFHNFLFVANSNSNSSRVYFSQRLEPEKFPSTGFIDVESGRSTAINAIQSVQDTLLIFKDQGIYAINGFGPGSFQLSDVATNIGAPNPEAVASSGGVVYFYDGDGTIFQMSGRSPKPISFPVEPDLESITQTNKVSLDLSDSTELHVSWESPEGKQREFVYRTDREAWIKNTGVSIRQYASRVNDTLLAGSRLEGKVYELDKTETDDAIMFKNTGGSNVQPLDDEFTARKFINEKKGSIDKVSVKLRKTNDASRAIQAQIWTSDIDNLPRRVVANSENTFDEEQLGNSFNWVDFKFDSDFVLRREINYHIVLVQSETIQLESSIDVTGTASFVRNDFSDNVSISANTPLKVAHGQSTPTPHVQYYNQNDEQRFIDVKVIDSGKIQLETSTDTSGTIVVCRPDYESSITVDANDPEVIRHNLRSEDIVVSFFNQNGEKVHPGSAEIVDDNKIKVQFSSDFDGRISVSRSSDAVDISLDSNTPKKIQQFSGVKYVFNQFWDSRQTGQFGEELVMLKNVKLFDSTDATGSEWRANQNGGTSNIVSQSTDAITWDQSENLGLSARIYTADIEVVAQTREIDLDQPDRRKQVRKIVANFDLGEIPFYVEVVADSQSKDEIQLVGEERGARWDSFNWNESEWAGVADIVRDKSVAPEAIGNKISFKITSVLAKNFRLTTFSTDLHVRNPR